MTCLNTSLYVPMDDCFYIVIWSEYYALWDDYLERRFRLADYWEFENQQRYRLADYRKFENHWKGCMYWSSWINFLL